MSVVDLASRRVERDPHIGGAAMCLACRHEWTAVAQVGTFQLDCPECASSKGIFKYPCNPPVGDLIRECNCGSQVFYVTPSGIHCWICGKTQVFE